MRVLVAVIVALFGLTEAAMAKSNVQEYGDWERFIYQLEPTRFTRALHKEVARANARIGSEFQRRARKAIQGAGYAGNSPMTVAMKGSSKPLVDDGDLMGALTWAQDRVDPMVVWLGLKRYAKEANIGRILHDGATVKVTPGMRRLLFARLTKLAKGKGRKARKAREFLAQWQDPSKPKGTGRLKGGGKAKQRRFVFAKLREEGKLARVGPPAKDVYVIPPRPFIEAVVRTDDFRRFALKEWSEAFERALHGTGGRA